MPIIMTAMSNAYRISILTFSSLIIFFAFLAPVIADGETQSQPWIRVVILTDASSVSISASGPSCINQIMTTESILSFDTGHAYSFDISTGQTRLNGTGGMTSTGFSIIQRDESGRLTCNGRSYRGIMRVQVWEGKLICVNVVPIEQYLWGVVPSEVPDTWPTETLKAQAVAARTYALRALMQYPDRPFDVYSSVLDQVYHGASGESEETTQACIDTSGVACTYDGMPIIAYYHAASGGWTASGEEMFGRNLPYLRAVPSRDATVYRWTYRIATSSLKTALRNSGFQVGNIQRIYVHRFSPEGRAEEIKIIHSDGVLMISGAELRAALEPQNLESTYFTVEGQDAPEIPDESTWSRTENAISTNSIEAYSYINPQIFIPYPVPMSISTCNIVSPDTIISPGTITVIGTEGEFVYTAGSIWVAQPERVSDLTTNSIASGFSYFPGTPPVCDPNTPDDAGTVCDPADGIGNPCNGTIVFVGHGCGHGVGMSQHGARILAEEGWTWDQILKYFYTGVELQNFWQ
jgi:stage II sporulation protein D